MGEATRAGLEEAIPEKAEAEEEAAEVFAPEAAAEPAALRTRTVVEYGPDPLSMGLTGMMVVGTAVMCVICCSLSTRRMSGPRRLGM